MSLTLRKDSLSLHFLNVGDGDSIIVELPEDAKEERGHLVIDSYNSQKTLDYLANLGANRLRLVVATHPHADHILGLKGVLERFPGRIDNFWDSGFRHKSVPWANLIKYLKNNRPRITFSIPASGFKTEYSDVDISVLAPSVSLKNRYDSFGVNINNASIALMLNYMHKKMILSGDAQWDSWAKITEEYPSYEKTSNPNQLIRVKGSYNPLKCNLLKVAHHGSKHGTALEALEKMKPDHSIISCGCPSRYKFPHFLSLASLFEIRSNIHLTCNGSFVYIVDGTGQSRVFQYTDRPHQIPHPPTRI